MRFLRVFYHFLGGVPFAVLLISFTAIFVIAGTFLESSSGSHRYAAAFTYSSPVFTVLLALFFINILVAALRRWPFQRRHIPFLITHLGLLTLLIGAIGKQFFGLQGNMSLVEGSGSQKILVSDTYALEIRSPHETIYQPLQPQKSFDSGPLHIENLQWRPNSRERLEFWIKHDWAYIKGLSPLPVSIWRKDQPLGPPVGSATIGSGSTSWNFFAIRTPDISDLAHESYLNGLQINISDTITHRLLGQIPLKQAIQSGMAFDGGLLHAVLDLNHLPAEGFQSPQLYVEITPTNSLLSRRLVLPLEWGAPEGQITFPFTVTLSRTPAVIVVADPFGDSHLWTFDEKGHVGSEPYRRESLQTLIAYRDGYGGYAAESSLVPALECPLTRHHSIQPPSNKMEDNLPLVLLNFSDDISSDEKVPLTYDRYGNGMRWPILEGRYLVRFQPLCCEIPYRLRLHHARQVTYPNSAQPYSYEAQVTVTDLRNGAMRKTVLSMNQVHETWDGYRFYLANLAPPEIGAVHQVQIIVNRDPFKYWLTYPGALILTLGILLLFTYRRQ